MSNEKSEVKKEKVSIFIDGSNFYHNLKRYNINISFEEVIKRLETKREVKDIFFYMSRITFDKTRYFSGEIKKM